MQYSPEDGKWHANPDSEVLRQLQKQFRPEQFEAQKLALKKFLCNYFSSADGCSVKQGSAISPVGATKRSGKILKVRWGLPGCGKSGGLRLKVVAYCDELRVYIADAFHRSDDPTTDDFLDDADKL